MRFLPPLCALCFVFAALPGQAPAAILTLAGQDLGLAGAGNDSVDRFRSTSVTKPLDPDGDAIYGTDGYILYATDTIGNANAGTVATVNPLTAPGTLASIPSYLILTNNAQNQTARSYGYRAIDDPTLGPGAAVADVESGAALRSTPVGTEISVLDLTINGAPPVNGFRMGVMIGNTDLYAGTIRLTQTLGGAGSATVNHPLTTAESLYFFDVTNAAAGDVFTLYLTKAAGSAGNANVLYGGLTFDTIPEPSLPALAAVALPGLLLRRRRPAKTF
jgi:hypothetical protein